MYLISLFESLTELDLIEILSALLFVFTKLVSNRIQLDLSVHEVTVNLHSSTGAVLNVNLTHEVILVSNKNS